MTTSAQTAANQANAQHSTGPTSEAGKQKASQNSLKHGFTSKSVLLPGEDPAAYNTLVAGFQHDFKPGNILEATLVELITNLQWRLLRVPALEARFPVAGEALLTSMRGGV